MVSVAFCHAAISLSPASFKRDKRRQYHWSPFITESQNPGVFWIGRDLKGANTLQ